MQPLISPLDREDPLNITWSEWQLVVRRAAHCEHYLCSWTPILLQSQVCIPRMQMHPSDAIFGKLPLLKLLSGNTQLTFLSVTSLEAAVVNFRWFSMKFYRRWYNLFIDCCNCSDEFLHTMWPWISSDDVTCSDGFLQTTQPRGSVQSTRGLTYSLPMTRL